MLMTRDPKDHLSIDHDCACLRMGFRSTKGSGQNKYKFSEKWFRLCRGNSYTL
jgi:hypothetical protein